MCPLCDSIINEKLVLMKYYRRCRCLYSHFVGHFYLTYLRVDLRHWPAAEIGD